MGTYSATFIVRLPLPVGASRREAESALRDYLLESGPWQGAEGVYVREAMHLTPEQEVYRAEQLRATSIARQERARVEAERAAMNTEIKRKAVLEEQQKQNDAHAERIVRQSEKGIKALLALLAIEVQKIERLKNA